MKKTTKGPSYGAKAPRKGPQTKPFNKRAAPSSASKPVKRPEKPMARPQKREKLQRKGVLLWGIHAVREAWLNPDRKCFQIWATESGRAALEETAHQATKNGLTRPELQRVERADLDHLLPDGSVHQGLVMDVAPLDEITLDDLLGQSDGPNLVVVLDQVTDPHNVGAILRSAAAFGAGAVIVTERNAPSATGTLAKTACGALEHVPLIAVVNIARAIKALKDESFWCVGLAEEGEKDLSECALASGRTALIMGAEGDGMRRLTREHCDELARLPTQGPIGSLNVSNASAISLYEVRRQRNKLSTT